MNCRKLILLLALAWVSSASASHSIDGTLQKWHRVTVTFDGPASSEDAKVNPFLDYRLVVQFTNGGRSVSVPGFYAADGNAAETSAESGDKWRVHFSPDATGEWSFKASFRTGSQVAISDDPTAGKPVAFDGETGRFSIAPTEKAYPDLRGRGRLDYTGTRYLRFAETGEIYLKGGPDSPENFLAYEDFDQTYSYNDKKQFLKDWAPHVPDWREGDPTWKDGKGKGIIGAINYLSRRGLNVVYFLTQNLIGDGEDVWPYTGYEERFRFDCSKLDQWEIVFQHMTRMGIVLHVVTQERENDQVHDGGALGPERKAYYRELIARFAHHPGIIWNLGEENTNTSDEIKSFCDYFEATDPYNHPVVLHTVPYAWHRLYTPLLGYPTFDALSVQTRDEYKLIHHQTVRWIQRSQEAGRPWPVFIDEPGIAWQGLEPDSKVPNNHATMRKYALWGNLMGGGSGVEWYFGYEFEHSDLTAQDFSTRDQFWNYSGYAVELLKALPLDRMSPSDWLVTSEDAYCLAEEGGVYAVYYTEWEPGHIDLREHPDTFEVQWYNPRNGDGPWSGSEFKKRYPQRRTGSLDTVKGGGWTDLGYPPYDFHEDWVIILKAASGEKKAVTEEG